MYSCQQIEYADMLKRVEPLRNELQALEDQAQTNVTAGSEVSEFISQLEKSIASYKEEYAQLISQAQAIKTDLGTVQAKVMPRFFVFAVTNTCVISKLYFSSRISLLRSMRISHQDIQRLKETMCL